MILLFISVIRQAMERNRDSKPSSLSNKKRKLTSSSSSSSSFSSSSSSSSSNNNTNHSSPKEDSRIKFEKDFQQIKTMRQTHVAPVDTMGSQQCLNSQIKTIDFKTYKFQALVSLILSSQTKDHITFASTQKLIEHGLAVKNVLSTSEETLKNLIFKCSFHNNKAKAIKRLAEVINTTYKGDPPELLDKVVKLPGIGMKMALIYLKDVCGKIEGIAVDTHIHKISNRLGWVNTKQPEKTRIELEKIVDRKYWVEINAVLVGFGQEVCKSVKPLCEKECSLKDRCVFYKGHVKNKKKENKKEGKIMKKRKEK